MPSSYNVNFPMLLTDEDLESLLLKVPLEQFHVPTYIGLVGCLWNHDINDLDTGTINHPFTFYA